MKILFVSPYPPAPDGIGTYTASILAAMRAAGNEARVVVPRPVPRSGDSAGSGGSGDADVIGALGPGSLADVIAWGPDVIHVQFAVAAFGTRTPALFAWLRRVRPATAAPVMATFHEVTRETAILRGPGRLLYRRFADRCDGVIVHTRGAEAMVCGRLGVDPGKVSVIPHPEARPPREVPDDPRERFGIAGARILLAFGFVHVDKGLDDLVAALGTLRRAGAVPLDDVRLVIAGAVRPRRGIFRVFEFRDKMHFMRVLGMARRELPAGMVVRTGYVPDEDVAGWFQAASAVVLPYRRAEQSGVASLANAFGVPVLASTAGGLGERYAGSRWTFPPGDRDALAGILGQFLAGEPAVTVVPGTSGVPGAPAPADREASLDRVVSATLARYRTES